MSTINGNTIEQLAEAAHAEHNRVIKKLKHRVPEVRTWNELAPITRKAWIAGVQEVINLTRPR